MQPQAHLVHPRGDRGKHMLGLPPALAIHDRIVGIVHCDSDMGVRRADSRLTR